MPGQNDYSPADEGPYGDLEPSWTRRRVVFLAISGVALAVLLTATKSVLLPFVLALIIAYVLTPLVGFCEQRFKMPRSLAILVVYAVTLGGIYSGVAAMAPRLYEETVHLTRDAPALIRHAAVRWGPRVDAWVNAYLERGGPASAADRSPSPPRPSPPRQSTPSPSELPERALPERALPEPGSPGSTPAGPPQDPALRGPGQPNPTQASPAQEPAISVAQRPDGTFAIEFRSGVDVIQENPRRWRISAREEIPPETFSVSLLVDEGLERFINYVKINAIGVLKLGQTIVANVARAIFLTFMTLMVAGYVMHTRERILGFFRSLVPPMSRRSFDRLLFRMDRGLSGVVRGQLLICLVNGLLSAVGFWIFDLNYWPILAILAGVMSIVPIFGSILSTVPAVAIGLTQDFWIALWVLLWIVGIHQVEANLLNPKIIGVSAKLHPVLVVFALLVGEHFFGLWGALLAVPVLSLTQSLFNHFRYEWLPYTGPDSLGAEELARRTGRHPTSESPVP